MLTRKYKKSFDDLLKYLAFNNISYSEYQKYLYRDSFKVDIPKKNKKENKKGG